MLEVFSSIVSLLITLGILVTIHEYGHFWVARRCGVKVLRFSVGFGRPIFTWTDKQGTEFVVATIPLGGYVRMLDEREAPVPEEQKTLAFNNKPVSQRIAIASAGPIANFGFAIFAYWLMFLIGFNVLIPTVGKIDDNSIAANSNLPTGVEIISVDSTPTPGWRPVSMALVNRLGESGVIEIDARYSENSAPEKFYLEVDHWLVGESQTDLVRSLGIHPKLPQVPAVIGQVLPGSPAERSGIQVNDRVIRIDNVDAQNWYEFVDVIKASEGREVELQLLRNREGFEQVVSVALRPEQHILDSGETVWRVGVGAAPFKFPDEMIRSISYGPIDSISHAFEQVWADTEMTLKAIRKMLIGLVSLENLSGPITIAQVANESISSGLEDFLRFLALLSVSLGVLNLLPIPVLDGGHILYYTIEAIIGRPIPEKWQVIGLKIGMSLILLLMGVAFYNDVMRLQ